VDKDLVFIVSGGRTGTFFFGQMLSEVIPDAYSVHEPDIFPNDARLLVSRISTFGIWHMVLARLLGRTGIRNLVFKRITGNYKSATQFEDAIRSQRQTYYSNIESDLIIESNAQWYGLLPYIRTSFPTAKVIGIIRDPRDWVPSWLSHGGRHDRRDYIKYFAQRRPDPHLVGDYESAKKWNSMDAFERLCWDWWFINREIDNFVVNDELSRMYRFEDLFLSDSNESLEDMLSFATEHPRRAYPFKLDPALRTQRLNSSRRSVGWSAWPKSRVRALSDFCGPLMEKYHYGREREWQHMLNSMSI